ncbi:MAG: DUF488 family protein [Proteobacteria bacterium]|nr:DUF488 family protein [Pseudomonadota bacterium]
MAIHVKRIYDKLSEEDGSRVLVDRLWPRGLKKEDAHIDLWLKEIAPSTELRKWFDHDPHKWEEFRKRYFSELKNNSETITRLLHEMNKGELTLLFSARNAEFNNAVALKEYLESITTQGK